MTIEEHETLWKLDADPADALDSGDRDRVARVAFEIG